MGSENSHGVTITFEGLFQTISLGWVTNKSRRNVLAVTFICVVHVYANNYTCHDLQKAAGLGGRKQLKIKWEFLQPFPVFLQAVMDKSTEGRLKSISNTMAVRRNLPEYRE